jgi:phosphoserine phosphatase
VKNLCLFDLDDTLLPIDSDHAWGEFLTRIGWVDAAEFARRNDAFYAQYKAGQLDIHEYIAFATEPLRTGGSWPKSSRRRCARAPTNWCSHTARAATWSRS